MAGYVTTKQMNRAIADAFAEAGVGLGVALTHILKANSNTTGDLKKIADELNEFGKGAIGLDKPFVAMFITAIAHGLKSG